MIHHKEITASTNIDARAGQPGDVYTADFQTAGRGRLDHVWQSAKAENLMFSIVLACGTASPAEVSTLPLIVGLAVAQTLSDTCPLQATPFSLKWPNDVMAGTRKVCGILCERCGDNVIAGIGVNVNQTAFAPDIAERATSLALLRGQAFDRDALLRDLVASLTAYHARWQAAGFAALQREYAAYDFLDGRTVSVLATDHDAAPITGLCGGVQPDGSLLVGDTPVYAGEAHVHSF